MKKSIRIDMIIVHLIMVQILHQSIDKQAHTQTKMNTKKHRGKLFIFSFINQRKKKMFDISSYHDDQI